MTEYPSLAAALAAVQAQLPTISKGETAEVEGKSKNGVPYKYKYRYADLADVSKVILPMLGTAGLSWVTRPTLREDGKFVLAYELMHVSGDGVKGEYPLLSGGTPQEIGSAITYARRYALCSVTGVAPEQDDDDGASASRPQRDQWDDARPAQVPPERARQNILTNARRAIANAGLDELDGIEQRIQGAYGAGQITDEDANDLTDAVIERRAVLERAELPDASGAE